MNRIFMSLLVLAVLAGGAALTFQLRPDLFTGLKPPTSAEQSATPTSSGEPKQASGKARGQERGGGGRGGPAAVEAAPTRSGSSSVDIRAVGSLRSDESVQIAPEIAGRVSEITFKEGVAVNRGDNLFKLDDALAKAEFDDVEARFKLAEANLARAKALSRTGNVTEKAQDEAASNFGTATAAVELAKVRLSKHKITAPFSGVVGSRMVSVGAYVNAGTPIVNLEKIDTLKVTFKLPEIHLADIKPKQKVEVTVDALPGEVFHGEIYAIDPQVDVNGRALQIRAFLPNRDMKLRPGLFARITVKGLREKQVVFVPESAIVPRAGQSYVYVIADGKAKETKVTLGQRNNAEVEILSGLASGATVVIAGQQNLRNGQAVDVIQGDKPAERKQASRQAS